MALNVITIPSVLPAHYLKKGKTESTVELNTSSEDPEPAAAQSSPHKKRWRKVLEVLLLTSVIVLVCAPFVTPTIVFALPPLSLVQMPPVIRNGVLNQTGCDRPINYSGNICYNELKTYQSCYDPLAGLSNVIHVPLETNQEEAEATATRLLQGLPLLSPSQECEAAIKPFLCLYLFGSCDSDNQSHQATRADCLRLKENICVEEWALAERYLGQGILPDCNAFEDEDINPCYGVNGSTLTLNETAPSATTTTVNITCAEGYYLSDNGTVCRPLCSNWVEPVNIDFKHIATIIIAATCLLSAIVLLVLAVTVQRNTMLSFPAYYLVYLCLTATAIGLILLTGLASKGKYFCSSFDLLETLLDETVYCSVSGVIFTYGLAQLGLFILFHAVGLCWGVVFPFHFRKFKAEEKLKYIHVTTVLIALFLPTVPALLHLEKGYSITGSPSTVCWGRSVPVTYYSLILPLSVISAIATSIFITLLWIFIKTSTLKKLSSLPHTKEDNNIVKRKAMAKLLFIMCYYVLLGALVLTLFTYLEAIGNVVYEAIEDNFTCHSAGLESGRDCGESLQRQLSTFRALSTVSTVVAGLLPSVILAFSVKCECKHRDKL